LYKFQAEAEAHMSNKEFDLALAKYNEALAVDPENPDIYHDKAVCLINADKRREALPLFDKALELQSDYSYRYASRGFLRYLLADINGARQDYLQALAMDPEDAVTQNNLELLEEKTAAIEEKKKQGKFRREMDSMLEASAVVKEREAEDQKEKENETGKKKESDSAEASSGKQEVIKEVFTSKSSFKEYVSFVFNGFKLKNRKD
jgi:tetratricopeptide (TPR) repeat protein